MSIEGISFSIDSIDSIALFEIAGFIELPLLLHHANFRGSPLFFQRDMAIIINFV